jgi:hypothetical protein
VASSAPSHSPECGQHRQNASFDAGKVATEDVANPVRFMRMGNHRMEKGMTQNNSAPTTSREQMDWVLSSPHMSAWLKNALSTARDRDPVTVLTDLEILNQVLRTWGNARIRSALEQKADGNQRT